MNPLTLVKRIQSINAKEADLGISDEASWHAKYKDSAYVFVGGIPYDLTEGDLLAVFAQYGEIVDVNLVRDKATGKSKGFAFVAYEDQRSTTLAVDNLNGASLSGRTIRVDHVAKYKKKEEEDEETERQKREERGVCRAFQKGECKYGDACKFSHDEQRAADTGWGHEEDKKSKWEERGVCRAFQKGGCKYGDACKFSHDEQRAADTGRGQEEDKKSKWVNDKFDNRSRDNKRSRDVPPNPPSHGPERKQPDAYDGRSYRGKDNEDQGKQTVERRSSRYDSEAKPRDDYDRREEKRSRGHDSQSSLKDSRDEREKDRDRNRDRDRDRNRDRDRDKDRDRDRDKDRYRDRERNKDRDREKRSYAKDLSPQLQRDRDDGDHRASREEDYHRSRR